MDKERGIVVVTFKWQFSLVKSISSGAAAALKDVLYGPSSKIYNIFAVAALTGERNGDVLKNEVIVAENFVAVSSDPSDLRCVFSPHFGGIIFFFFLASRPFFWILADLL